MAMVNQHTRVASVLLSCLLMLSMFIFVSPTQANTHEHDSGVKPTADDKFLHTGLSKAELKHIVDNALITFNTPGMALAIVKNGELIHSQGYGLANIQKQQAVKPSTFFRLASTSKAFTAAALAILVDEGKLEWDDPVVTYLPEFKMYDAYVSAEFTITDLLTHRSGLVSGAGDSMIWPEPSGFTRQEVIHNLRFLSPEYSFRSKYAYSNVLYITAGELVAKISGMSFEQFVEQHIFEPLDMNCFVGDMPKKALKHAAMGYAHNDERGIYPVTRNRITETGLMSAAAGGMVCDINSMAKWAKALLEIDNLPFSEKQLDKMFSPQTILGISKIEKEWDNTFLKSYGLGWRLSNLENLKMISHTGTLSGYQAYIALLPQLDLGVVILNNGSNSAARGSVMQTVLKAFINSAQGSTFTYTTNEDESNTVENTENDWVANYVDYLDEREKRYIENYEAPEPSAPMSIESSQVVGQYEDKWFGKLVITQEQNRVQIRSDRMTTLVGELQPFQDTTFKVVWDNKNAAGPAFMHFSLNIKREVVSAKLHPFSVEEYVNHAYRDMEFFRVIEE